MATNTPWLPSCLRAVSERYGPLPLAIPLSSKRTFYMNMNNYRNQHYRSLSKAKRDFCAHCDGLWPSGISIPPLRYPLIFFYELYLRPNYRHDLSNVGSVLDKFFADYLVDTAVLEDDDTSHVNGVIYHYGGDDPSPHGFLTLCRYKS